MVTGLNTQLIALSFFTATLQIERSDQLDNQPYKLSGRGGMARQNGDFDNSTDITCQI